MGTDDPPNHAAEQLKGLTADSGDDDDDGGEDEELAPEALGYHTLDPGSDEGQEAGAGDTEALSGENA